MTEADLLEMNFTRIDETDWHYYTYDINSLILITPSSDEVMNDEWYVELFESNAVRFTSRTQLEILITLFLRNAKK